MKHTPLPWNSFQNIITDNSGDIYTTSKVIAHTNVSMQHSPERYVTIEEDKANADFIIMAVNCHYELLSALSNLVNGIQSGGITSEYDETLSNALKQALSAINKTKGE